MLLEIICLNGEKLAINCDYIKKVSSERCKQNNGTVSTFGLIELKDGTELTLKMSYYEFLAYYKENGQ